MRLSAALLLVFAVLSCLPGVEFPPVPRQDPAVRSWPVLHQGRVKPIEVAAEELLLGISGKAPFGETEQRENGIALVRKLPNTDLLIAMLLAPQAFRQVPLIHVPWKPLQQELGINGQWMSLEAVMARSEVWVPAVRRNQEAQRTGRQIDWSRDDQAKWDLALRIDLAESTLRGQTLAVTPLAVDAAERATALAQLVPTDPASERPWHRRWQEEVGTRGDDALRKADLWLSFEDLIRLPDPLLASLPADGSLGRLRDAAGTIGSALARGDAAPLPGLIALQRERGLAHDREYGAAAVAHFPSSALITTEVLALRLRPFTWAWIGLLLGGVLMATGLARARRTPGTGQRMVAFGTALTWFGLFCCTVGLGIRTAITGLGAVTNLYETIIFVALVTGVLGLILARTTKNPAITAAAAITAACCAMVGEAMPPELGSQIPQLQPVLRSRFWLWIHVKTIVASYAAYALALGLANWYLWRAWRERRAVDADEGRALYRCLQVGTVLIVAGTLLGAWWADEAWGRFWGWDPKEIGALIIILTYLIPLHLRYVGLAGPTALAAWSVFGFLSVLWSWYGINFLLGAGLHAYGFGQGGQHIVLPIAGLEVLWAIGLLRAIRRARIAGQSPGV